jgi:cellulose synthase/poly-beta-1,6-N-acetylglucosamine synthase-like glycosyltransferase
MVIPAVSIIVPCYNAEFTLRTAVESVLRQSFSDFELIVVDDGSSDGSVAVAERLATESRRIRLIRQRNAGPAAARNRGVAEASGEFIAFLDADDRWMENLLHCHVTQFKLNSNCGISFGRVRFFGPSLARPGRVSARIRRLTLAQVLGENPICTTSNLVARRSAFDEAGGFDPELTHGEDQEFVARVLATTQWQAHGLPQILVHYRTSPGEADRAHDEAVALFHRYLSRRALRTGQTSCCRTLMRQAWSASPRALLLRQPHRTAMTMLGLLAAMIPGNPARAMLAR